MSEPSETIIHDLAASGLVCVCDAEACTEQRRKLVAVYGRHVAAPQWQGIESAPRDDTDILLAWADGHQQIDRLSNGEASFWFENAPTHWMPLPAPPKHHSTSRPGGSTSLSLYDDLSLDDLLTIAANRGMGWVRTDATNDELRAETITN